MDTQTSAVNLIPGDLVLNISRMALFAALMGAFAFVSFPNPLSPAPVNLQVLGVFLAAILLGPVWGSGAIVVYLVAGILGAPVFSGGSAGIGVILGPTGGYLLSYPIATAIIGLLIHRGFTLRDHRAVSLPLLIGAMVVGTILIYTMGVIGMMISLGLGPVEAFIAGAVVFIPAEVFKIAAAVGIIRSQDLAISA